METWRIKAQLNDKSAKVGSGGSFGIGGTVIPASRGPITPVKINKGEATKICQLFKADRYEVLEAIAYNTKYPLFISAPFAAGGTAGIALTDLGVLPFSFGNMVEDLDFNQIMHAVDLGTADGKTTDFSAIYKSELVQSFTTPVGSEPILKNAYVFVNDVATKLTIAKTPTGMGGTCPFGNLILENTAAETSVTFMFNDAPEKNAKVSIRFETDVETLGCDVYGALCMKFPCSDYMAVKLAQTKDEGIYDLTLYEIKKGTRRTMGGYPKKISFTPGTTNDNGINIYFKEVLKEDPFITFVPYTESPRATPEDLWANFAAITGGTELDEDFKYGFRGAEATGQMLVEGWTKMENTKKYSIDIYFDLTANSLIPNKFIDMRNTKAKYKRYLFPQRICTATDMISGGPLSYSNRGLTTFWGAALVQNPFEATGDLASTLLGEVAAKYADALVHSYSGRAVAWSDENKVGGQLSMGRIVKFIHTCTEDENKAMDELRINPIGPNELFGPIIMSRRSTDKSSGDYSYADYSGIFDYCIERTLNEVLPYQIVKFNDDTHRSRVRTMADNIVKPLTAEPNNVLRDYAIKCDDENNGDDVLGREEFVLTMGVKVTSKSRMIFFNFINSAQGASVEEDVQ